MPEKLAVDYSFARPSPVAIRRAGYTAVGRYLGGSSSKRLTRAEATELLDAGLGIWLVYEGSADRAKAGRSAGEADAKAARADAAVLGYPVACPIFFAVDFDGRPDQVREYFAGVASVLGGRTGIYGGLAVTTAGLAHWRWQTAAWSGGRVDPHAHLYQRTHMTHPISGCDENVICHPIQMWTREHPAPKPKPKPGPRKPNRVQQARPLLRQAATLLEATPNHRVVCHAQARVIRKVLKRLPKK